MALPFNRVPKSRISHTTCVHQPIISEGQIVGPSRFATVNVCQNPPAATRLAVISLFRCPEKIRYACTRLDFACSYGRRSSTTLALSVRYVKEDWRNAKIRPRCYQQPTQCSNPTLLISKLKPYLKTQNDYDNYSEGTGTKKSKILMAIEITPIIQKALPASVWNLKIRTKIIPPRFPQDPTRPDMKPWMWNQHFFDFDFGK